MTKFTVKKFRSDKPTLRQKMAGSINVSQARLSILLMGVIIFASLSYLFYINQTATGGFDNQGIENRIDEISKNNSLLLLEVAQLQSLTTIEAASAELELVATSYIEYLPAVGSAVAVR